MGDLADGNQRMRFNNAHSTTATVADRAAENSMHSAAEPPSFKPGFISADMQGIDATARQLTHIGNTLADPQPVEDAQLHIAALPQASGLIQALQDARCMHGDAVRSLASFYRDASVSLTALQSQIDGHEHATAQAWGAWSI